MPRLSDWPEPALEIRTGGDLPYLVEHWHLGPRVRHYMSVRRFREVLAAADLRSGQEVLDVGCGWGYGTFWARARGARVTGIDLGMDQLRWAHRNLPDSTKLGLTNANAKALPFRDGTFDRVVSVEMMEHVFRPDRPAVFAELARVLKPGGRLALSTPNPSSPIERLKQVAVAIPALRRALPSACFPEASDEKEAYHPYRYHHPLTLAGLRSGFSGVGLRLLGARRFLWVMKTLPDGWFGPARVAETVAETLPLVRRMGATTLVWAEKRAAGEGG